MKILELFSGYGTSSFALKQLEIPYELIGYSDIDKYANQCFKQNHCPEDKEDKLRLGDVRNLNPNDLSDFDLLTGGFPCQSFSVAGKMKGELDTRGTLFYEIIRIAEVKKPKYMLLENVKGLTCKKFADTFNKILSELDRIGYNVYWKVLNTKDFGIPQSRARVWFVCIRKDIDEPLKFQFPQPFALTIFIKDILEKEVDKKYYLSEKLQERFSKYLENKGKDLEKENISPRRVRDLQKSDSFITSWDLSLFGDVSKEEKEILECWRFNHRSTKFGDLSVGNGMTKEEIEKILNRDISNELKLIIEKGYLLLKEDGKLYSNNCRKIQGQAGFGFLMGNNSYSPTITCATLTENAVCDYNDARILDLYNHKVIENGLCPTLSNPCHNNLRLIEGEDIVAYTRRTNDLSKVYEYVKEKYEQDKKPVQIDLYHLLHGEIRPITTYITENTDFSRCLQGSGSIDIIYYPNEEIKLLQNHLGDIRDYGNKCRTTLTSIGAKENFIQEIANTIKVSGRVTKPEFYFEKKEDNFVYSISNASKREMDFKEEVSPTLMGRDYKDPKIVSNAITTAVGRSGHSDEELGYIENNQRCGQLRRLTPKECFRLQGFLNDEVDLTGLSDTQCYKLAGNGQSVNVVKLIFKEMFK